MRRSLLAVLTVALAVLGTAGPALAHPGVALDPTLPTDVTFAATDNVDYLGRFPEHSGTAGGSVGADGDLFYLTDPRGVYVYDISAPESPELLGSIALFQTSTGTGAALAQEDPDTNGEILLVDASPTPFGEVALQVVDVSDPANLSVLSTIDVADHTWTCVSTTAGAGAVNGCAYAYGRTGHIVDLTDPAAPVLLDDTWRAAVGYGDRSNSPYTHDLTEIRPGLVMSAGSDAILMDTSDPAVPVRLAAIEQGNPRRFSSLGYHSVEWANGGTDPYVVLGTEIAPDGATNLAGSDCQGEESVIETWDASAVVTALKAYDAGEAMDLGGATFTRVDAYDAGGRGIFLDGAAPAHLLYCAHWMELHPEFDGGGLMAVSYYDRGTRFVDVAQNGTMTEVGWIVPAEGYSGSAQWITDEVVYIMDYRRGLEVVRLTTDQEATGVTTSAGDLLAAGSGFVPASRLHTDHASGWALAGFGVVLLGRHLRRRGPA